MIRLFVLAGVLLSLPLWLPRAILALRNYLFTRINGREGVFVPGPRVGPDEFKALYAHPAANGRSRGATLSDLFWYWLSPGAHVHQEHIEDGARYDDVAAATRRFLSVPKRRAEDLAARCMGAALDRAGPDRLRLVRLRDTMMPVWAAFYFELIFAEACPPDIADLIAANAGDTLNALKGVSLRDMATRARLTDYLRARLARSAPVHPLPASLSAEEQILHLQGVYFSTAVIQMSEAMTHLIMALAENRHVEAKLAEGKVDRHYFDRVIAETLRLYPLFGVAHRITTDEIRTADGSVLPKGSVLCFNYLDYQRTGFENGATFDPDRWLTISEREATYVPFGVSGNRPCPAHAVALISMRAAGRAFLVRYRPYTSAAHTRSIPNRGPCLLVPRPRRIRPAVLRILLAVIAARDAFEAIGRSLAQLVFGTFMVCQARRQRLAETYFAAGGCPLDGHPAVGPVPARGADGARCRLREANRARAPSSEGGPGRTEEREAARVNRYE